MKTYFQKYEHQEVYKYFCRRLRRHSRDLMGWNLARNGANSRMSCRYNFRRRHTTDVLPSPVVLPGPIMLFSLVDTLFDVFLL